MSLDKAIENGREHRKPYSGAKAIDRTCRNHGGLGKKHTGNQCVYCRENRLHQAMVQDLRVREEIGNAQEN